MLSTASSAYGLWQANIVTFPVPRLEKLQLVFTVCVCVFYQRDAAIAFTERIKSGVVGEQLWLQISEPTEKDKGKYAIEFFDGKGGLRRTVELAGQGEETHDHIRHAPNLVTCLAACCLHYIMTATKCHIATVRSFLH